MTESRRENWLYCTYCERAFLSNSKSYCIYDNCFGNLGDIWDWEIIRNINKGYPEMPVAGREYPLYGDGRFINLRRAGYEEKAASHLRYNC